MRMTSRSSCNGIHISLGFRADGWEDSGLFKEEGDRRNLFSVLHSGIYPVNSLDECAW